MKLNRCTAELQAQTAVARSVGVFHPSEHPLDPIFQALQKFQSTSMTSSSPLALGGFFVKRLFLGGEFGISHKSQIMLI